jgi:hypothetical protein
MVGKSDAGAPLGAPSGRASPAPTTRLKAPVQRPRCLAHARRWSVRAMQGRPSGRHWAGQSPYDGVFSALSGLARSETISCARYPVSAAGALEHRDVPTSRLPHRSQREAQTSRTAERCLDCNLAHCRGTLPDSKTLPFALVPPSASWWPCPPRHQKHRCEQGWSSCCFHLPVTRLRRCPG